MELEIKSWIESFNIYSKEYPLFAGGLGLWVLGTGTYILKSVPMKLWDLIVRNCTTKLILVNTSETFHLFLKWYEDNKFSHNSRSIKISNGQWGYDKMIKAMGYGNHYFIFNRTPIRLRLSEKESVGSNRERDQIEMTIIGRSHKTYNKIFESIKDKDLDKGKTILNKFMEDSWRRVSEQRLRKMDTIYLNNGVKEKILSFIGEFRNREKFNLTNGIGHQTAIMLYGPPGTGKSSIILALAGFLDMQIHDLNASALSKIEGAFSSLPEYPLVVIEDIDSEKMLHSRDKIPPTTNSNSPKNEPLDKVDSDFFSFTSMSDVLNAIQGLHCSHGRILIATTNYYDKLDKALVRSGRFNLKIEIGYADNYVVEQFINRFFPDEKLPQNFQIKDNTPSSDVEKAVLDNLNNFNGFINKIKA